MQLSVQLFLFCFVMSINTERCSNLRKMVSFNYLRPLWSVSSRFWLCHIGFCKYSESMSYSYVTNGFYFSLRSRSGGTSAQTYEEYLNLSIFSRLGLLL